MTMSGSVGGHRPLECAPVAWGLAAKPYQAFAEWSVDHTPGGGGVPAFSRRWVPLSLLTPLPPPPGWGQMKKGRWSGARGQFLHILFRLVSWWSDGWVPHGLTPTPCSSRQGFSTGRVTALGGEMLMGAATYEGRVQGRTRVSGKRPIGAASCRQQSIRRHAKPTHPLFPQHGPSASCQKVAACLFYFTPLPLLLSKDNFIVPNLTVFA